MLSGRPEPAVRWWRDRELLDAKDGPGDFQSTRRSTLVLKNLNRTHLHAKFTCQASNNNISVPASTSVAIEMHRNYTYLFDFQPKRNLTLGLFSPC